MPTWINVIARSRPTPSTVDFAMRLVLEPWIRLQRDAPWTWSAMTDHRERHAAATTAVAMLIARTEFRVRFMTPSWRIGPVATIGEDPDTDSVLRLSCGRLAISEMP